MPFHHPAGKRERILAIGAPGSGKSYSWGKIAKRLQSSGSDARVYVIDTDFSAERLLSDPAFADVDNVEFREVLEWPEYMAAVRDYRAKMTHDDWLVVDMIAPAWDAAQDYFIEGVFGSDPADYFMQIRKDAESDDSETAKAAKSKRGGFEGRRDWGVINKIYREFSTRIASCPGNVFLASPADVLSKQDREDKDMAELYGRFGVKPKGQKHTGHIVHTILKFADTREGYKMTAIKDRSRELAEGEKFTDFSLSYLVKHAGWKLK